MTMTKRIFAALLCAATLSLTLASCGGGDTGAPNSGADTTAADAAETTTAAVETEPPEYVEPATKYDGQTFVFASLEQPNPNWIARHYVEAACPEQNGDAINDSIYERIKATEEATGVEIESYIFNDAAVISNTIIAGDHVTDTLLMAGISIKNLLVQNMLTDLNIIDTLDLDASWWNQSSIEQTSIDNKLFIASGDISPFGMLAAYCPFVNKGMLRSFNLDDPYQAVRDGKWTYDMMAEMGKVVASDVNGDGIMDEEDVFGYSSEGIAMVTMGACGVKFTEKDENDIPVLALNQDRASAAAEKIVTMFRDKNLALYNGDYSSKGYKNVFREVIVQKFIEDEVLFVNNWMCIALDLRDMESDFGILPPPKLDEDQDDYYAYNSETWTTYAAVPKTAVDLDMVGDVMNALGYFGKQFIYTALIDTTITSKTLRDTDTEEMMEIIYNNRVFDLMGIYNWGTLNSTLNTLINSNTTDFTSKYAAIEAKVIEEMQQTVENQQ